MTHQWDLLISGAKVFDGTGGAPVFQDVAVKGGRVVARGESLPPEIAAEVINAEGRWLLPGMASISTLTSIWRLI